ncbi:hypothetical protein M422DRAFT_267426 [Sphaerobolus stellatus SS14]|uniref:NADH:flavin oxidoreductase/NADH oxidase N-terminal domain-containing protein n=1 Tax=Sphaerobolus stellatus (strain SS14) TaxID=990650 RepID=A0A0C9V050_SPHS4|nr:hypothetical protein M422DRAFT_267426 [Sphaerobolus stellatus SS14]
MDLSPGYKRAEDNNAIFKHKLLSSLTPAEKYLIMSSLSTPTTLGAVEIRNRNVISALTRNRSLPTNIPNDTNVDYYKQRAHGGAGLIVIEGTLICQQGTEWPHAPGIYTAEHVAAWRKITDVVHAEGAKIFSQLWHQPTLAIFKYVITELDAIKLAYIAILQYVAAQDLVIDGKLHATQHDVIAAYQPLIKNSNFILNGGLTPSEAADLIQSGTIDAAAFRMLWISHPDM